MRYLEALATKVDLEPLGDSAEVKYNAPGSEPVVLTNVAIPLDEVEDLLLESAAHRLIAFSEVVASSNVSAGSGRTLLASSENRFIGASLAHIHGIPGTPD